MTPEQQEAELSTLSATLERDWWTATGIEEQLGGEASTDAAFDSVTAALIKEAYALRDDPSYGRFGGGVRTADGISLGGMMFAGWLLAGVGADAVVTSTNTLKPGERPDPVTRSDADSSVELSGSLESASMESALTKTVDGITGKVRTTIDIAPCPDANGVFTAKVLIEASAETDKGRTGSNTSTEVAITGRVGDDAELAGHDTSTRTQAAEYKARKGSFVEVTGTSAWEGDTLVTSSRQATRAGGAATDEMAVQWANMGTVIEAMVSHYVLGAAEKGWKSGRCVELQVTTAPAKRTGLAPSATVAVTAAPNSKIDGAAAGGTVTATLVGGASIDPADTAVPADASFSYVAPGEKDKAATVAFEAKSKRGIAKAKAEFDTRTSTGYFIGPVTGGFHTTTGLGIGSKDDGSAMGTAQPADVCDITKPFTLTSPSTGGRQTFTPTSETGGTTTYQTTMPMTGFVEKGKGTYTLVIDGDGGTIRTKVKGKLTIPGAGQFYKTSGEQVFSLQPASSCS